HQVAQTLSKVTLPGKMSLFKSVSGDSSEGKLNSGTGLFNSAEGMALGSRLNPRQKNNASTTKITSGINNLRRPMLVRRSHRLRGVNRRGGIHFAVTFIGDGERRTKCHH